MKIGDIFTDEELSDLYLTYVNKGEKELHCKIAKMKPIIEEKAKQEISLTFIAYFLIHLWGASPAN